MQVLPDVNMVMSRGNSNMQVGNHHVLIAALIGSQTKKHF